MRDARRCGVVAVVSGDGMERLFHVARRDAAAGRADAQPLDLRAAGRHPRRPRRGGRRAAELAQRRDGRRARRRAVGEEGRRRADALAAGGARRPRSRSTPTAARGRTPPRCATRWRAVRTGAVTGAARDDAEERPARFHRGDAVGFIDERIVAWGEPRGDARGGARRARPRGGAAHADRRRRRAAGGATAVTGLVPAGVELEYSWGGQPAYWWLIAAE